jgi:hypothetical protein
MIGARSRAISSSVISKGVLKMLGLDPPNPPQVLPSTFIFTPCSETPAFLM